MTNTGRTFQSPLQFLRELGWMLFHPLSIVRMLIGKRVDPRLRERVMLAVTEVNRCTFCAWAHTRMALKEGVPREEVDSLIGGSLDGVPPEHATAVLYAQHWADTGGRPDAGARARFEAAHDAETVRGLDTAMRFIRFCNYFGVLAERVLLRVSFGRVRLVFPAKRVS